MIKTLITICIMLITSNCFAAAINPLEIVTPKLAGTGSPALPSTNRIFKAYPGVTYNIRPAVIGGVFPYQFALSGQPAGMSIDQDTGEITWTNPQADSGTITLTVTDSELVQSSSSWVVSVTTAGFVFVDASYAGSPESGTISQPYKTIDSMLTSLTEASRESIVYFRGGSYSLPVFHPSYYMNLGCNLDAVGFTRPYKWVGYPGETVNIDAAGHYVESLYLYFDNLHFSGFAEYGIRTAAESAYNTVRRCEFSGLTTSRTSNDNQGFYFTETGSVVKGNYHIIQENSFHDYGKGTSAIGSIYWINKILIEDNHVYNYLGGSNANSLDAAIAYKAELHDGTIRHNRIETTGAVALGTDLNSNFYESANTEICFNYFNVGAGNIAHRFNNDAFRSHPQGLTNYYRNTIVGEVVFHSVDGSNCAALNSGGPWNIDSNVIINPVAASYYTKLNHLTYHTSSTNSPQNCINDTDNLKGVVADNIIDSNGELTVGYNAYFNVAGWEYVYDGQAPPDTTPPTTTASPAANRSSAKQNVTLSCVDDTSCTATTYCTGATTCTPATTYTGAVTVFPGSYLCYKSTDGTNEETAHCEQYRWSILCR